MSNLIKLDDYRFKTAANGAKYKKLENGDYEVISSLGVKMTMPEDVFFIVYCEGVV